MTKINYNKMCYTEFIEHLESKNIQYIENTDVDIDYWFCEYVRVYPNSKSRLAIRYFSTDGGHQLKR